MIIPLTYKILTEYIVFFKEIKPYISIDYTVKMVICIEFWITSVYFRVI